MEIHSAEIVKVYKSDITLTRYNKRYRRIRTYSLLFLLLVPVIALACIGIGSNGYLGNIYHNACNLYNPIYSPYIETSNMTFAWNYDFSEDVQDFDMPIVSSDYRVETDGTVVAKVKESIMVKSVADGVVVSVSQQDGVKSIKIAYSNDLTVEYINMDVLGVNEGNIVERGKQIGTAKLGDEIMFKAYLGNNQIKGFKIENNKLVWQN